MQNKMLRSIILSSTILMIVMLAFSGPVAASPGLDSRYDSSPTTETAHAGVDDPPYAHDGLNGTYARIAFDKSEWEEVTTFNITGAPTTEGIGFVDFKMIYESQDGGTGENYRIVYYVGSAGPVVLQDWTGENGAVALNTRTWLGQSEPNDGVWNWTDVQNIKLRVEGGTGGGGAAYFYEHEAWISVRSYTMGTMFIAPSTLTDPSSPFTVNVNVSNVEDLYGWEFKLYYNNTILSNSTVSEGTMLSGAGSTYFVITDNTDNYNATHGRFWVSCTLLGDVQGVTGSGNIATVTFTVDGSGGTTPLKLEDTRLVGYEYVTNKRVTYMLHSTTDGQVTITGAVPEFPLGLALELALGGLIVYVWWRGKRKTPNNLSTNTPFP